MIFNSRYLAILFFLLLQVSTEFLFSQTDNYLSGRIIISATSDPVQFAAVKLKNHQLVVFANAEGDFKIILNPEFHRQFNYYLYRL